MIGANRNSGTRPDVGPARRQVHSPQTRQADLRQGDSGFQTTRHEDAAVDQPHAALLTRDGNLVPSRLVQEWLTAVPRVLIQILAHDASPTAGNEGRPRIGRFSAFFPWLMMLDFPTFRNGLQSPD